MTVLTQRNVSISLVNKIGLPGGALFSDCYGFANCADDHYWGDAARWRAVATQLGIPCDDAPRRGSVAYFGATGQVGFVERVAGNDVYVSADDLDLAHDFGIQRLRQGDDGYPECFIQALPPGVAMNDTGMDGCADGTDPYLDCPVLGYPGQDAESDRDVTHNDPSDGHAGFSFTKLDAEGAPLASDAPIWSCVRDNVTGLIWEVKTDDGGLHDRNWSYSWYDGNPGTNGGDAGEPTGSSCLAGRECNTAQYVDDVNAEGLCGARDWRLPTVDELLSIVQFGKIVRNDIANPSIDADYFSDIYFNPQYGWFYWSSTTYASTTRVGENAWAVDFSNFNRRPGHDEKFHSLPVRLVRAAHGQ